MRPAPKTSTISSRASRWWRQDILADLGGEENVSAAKAALLDASIGTFVVLHTIDAYFFGLGGGRVNKRSKKLFGVVIERMRVAETLTRQLQAIGLEKKRPPAISLQSYITQLGDASDSPREVPQETAAVRRVGRGAEPGRTRPDALTRRCMGKTLFQSVRLARYFPAKSVVFLPPVG